MDRFPPLTAYVHMHALAGASDGVSRLRADALRALRDEIATLGGVRVAAVPQGSDLEIEITNVLQVDDGPRARAGVGRPRILVVRLGRRGERLDFVCTDGLTAMPAERQAARRIRGWIAAQGSWVGMTPHATFGEAATA